MYGLEKAHYKPQYPKDRCDCDYGFGGAGPFEGGKRCHHSARAGQKEIGVVAQEVESVFPELVASSAEGYKSVDYAKLTAVLIEAVKELKTENESLNRRLQTLEVSRDSD